MSTGRRNNRSYTSTHGGEGRSVTVAHMDALLRGPASVQERVYGPSPEEMRRAIGNGECPFCGKSFKNIAKHTNSAHGVDRHQLREMAGLIKSAPVCSPELSATQAARMRQEMVDNPDRLVKLLSAPKPARKVFSEAGKQVNRDKLVKARAAQAGKWVLEDGWTREQWAEYMHARLAEARKATAAERDPKLVRSVLEGATIKETCERFDVCPKTVRNALDAAGVEINLRSRRFDDPQRLAASREALTAGAQRRAEKFKAERLARWAELGKTWEAVGAMAREFGSDEKSMRQWLRDAGEHVPDGRAASNWRAQKTHCANGHDYAKHGRVSPKGFRICRLCEYASKMRWKAKKGVVFNL